MLYVPIVWVVHVSEVVWHIVLITVVLRALMFQIFYVFFWFLGVVDRVLTSWHLGSVGENVRVSVKGLRIARYFELVLQDHLSFKFLGRFL